MGIRIPLAVQHWLQEKQLTLTHHQAKCMAKDAISFSTSVSDTSQQIFMKYAFDDISNKPNTAALNVSTLKAPVKDGPTKNSEGNLEAAMNKGPTKTPVNESTS